MKRLFTALLILAGIGANAASYITVTNTFTNRTVVGDSFTVNGTTVRFTNAPLNNTAWLPTNSAAASATNVQRWFGRTQPAIYARLVNATNTAMSGTDLIYTISGGFGYLTTNTAGTTNQFVVEYPWQNLPTAKKTNQADALIEGIGTYGHTNSFPANSQALTNFVGRTNAQTLTRKTLTTPTITGPTVSALTNWGGILSNMTQIQVTNLDAQAAQIAGGSLSNVYILNALSMRGIITALSNGTTHGTSVTNAPMLHGTNLTAFSGYLSNIIGHTVTITNLSAPGTGTSSQKIGSGSIASGSSSLALGVSAEATNANSIAIGTSAASRSQSAIVIGSGAYSDTTGTESIAIGVEAGATGPYSIAIGGAAITSATHTNSVAIGNLSASTTANQIVLGTSAEKLTVPGRIEGATTTNTWLRGTNNVDAELKLAPRVNSATISGYASAINLGTNAYVRVTGASGAFTNASFTGGYAGMRVLVEVVNPGLSCVLLHQSSIGSPASTEKINTGTGALVNMTNNPAVFELIHNGTEWLRLWNSN